MNEAQIVLWQFLETGKDSSVMFDFTNKTFNQVSFPIKMAVIFSARSTAVMSWRNDDFSARSSNTLDKGFGIVSFVGNQVIKNNAVNQIIRLPMVALLAAAQNKTHGISQSINRQVNLGRKAAARAT